MRLCGNAEAVADARSRLQTRCNEQQLHMQKAALAEWEKLEQTEVSATTIVRLADLPSRIAVTLQIAQKLAAKAGTNPTISAHAGDGIVRVLLRDSDVENTAFAIGEARSMVVAAGGTLIAHSHNGNVMRRADAYGATGPMLQFMAKLKQLFDPASILAPGRFVI
jgi:FAD/FMN-containing dehydrogenase